MNKFGSNNLGSRIRHIRDDLSQFEFGRRVQCTRKQIADWEVGRTEPKIEVLERIAREFQIDYVWLTTGITKEKLDEKFEQVKEKIKEQALTEEEWRMLTALRKLRINTFVKFNLCFDYSKAVERVMDEVNYHRVAESQIKYSITKKKRKDGG